MKAPKPALTWSSLFLITFLATTLYIFLEWLFAVTRPSYMINLGFAQQVQIFLFASALLGGLCFLLLLPLSLLSLIPRLKPYHSTLIHLGALLPALICTSLILMLVDNFTYTLFKFGIVSSTGLSRLLYLLGFLLVAVLCYRSLLNAMAGLTTRFSVWKGSPNWIFGVLIGTLLLCFAVPAITNRFGVATIRAAIAADAEQRPNIILITSDGVDATHMSLYGYERDTTPELRKLAESALVAENAFSNAGNSAGSVISIYTGKYPAATRLLHPPNILKGSDAYEHLPGILRSLGYHTVQITLPYFVDSYNLNVLDGFDESNGRVLAQSQFQSAINQVLPSDYAFFTYETANRILDRVRHIFFHKKMTNPIDLVTSRPKRLVDRQRLANLKQVIRTADRPVFVHIHLMGTHGDTFNPREQRFSAGQSIADQEPWNMDFYDDSILELDHNIATLVADLKDLGSLDQTILVIGSDHGQRWDQVKRLPLLFRFPNGQYAGRIQANVQNLDIAPTILDYIGVNQPEWMSGKSLIDGEVGQQPIIGVSAQGEQSDQSNPPFYQFHEITLIDCQKWYRLILTNLSWSSGQIEGSTAACPPNSQITGEQALQWMVEHLKRYGFDVSSLDNFPLETPDGD